MLALCKGPEEFDCLIFFVSMVCSGKLEYNFPYSQLDLDVQRPEFPNLDQELFSQSSHAGTWLRPGSSKGCYG